MIPRLAARPTMWPRDVDLPDRQRPSRRIYRAGGFSLPRASATRRRSGDAEGASHRARKTMKNRWGRRLAPSGPPSQRPADLQRAATSRPRTSRQRTRRGAAEDDRVHRAHARRNPRVIRLTATHGNSLILALRAARRTCGNAWPNCCQTCSRTSTVSPRKRRLAEPPNRIGIGASRLERTECIEISSTESLECFAAPCS